MEVPLDGDGWGGVYSGTGGGDGHTIGVGNDGSPIVVITPTNPSPSSTPIIPSMPPTFPADPSAPYSGSEGGNGSNGGAANLIQISVFDRFQYPTLAKIVDGLYEKVKNNKELMDALKQFTHLTEEQILQDLRPGVGPIINVVDRYSIEGAGRYNPETKGALISDEIASNANYFSTQYPSAAELFLSAMVLHEYIHIGEEESQIFLPHVNDWDDAGMQFETAYYGGILDFNPVTGEITYKIKKP